jgi:hypothetical protein
MKRSIVFVAFVNVMLFSSCAKKESTEAPKVEAEAAKPAAVPAADRAALGPHAFIHLKNGTRVPGFVVASTKTDMVVAGDDGIERKIPLGQIKSVDYAESQPAQPVTQARREPSAQKAPARDASPSTPASSPLDPQPATETAQQAAKPVIPAPKPVTTKTYELPAGSELSVRTNEAINSETATEGQTFDAQITRDATDANGDVVVPRGSRANVVIKSASKGGRFKGTSDLVLDLQSITINGRPYTIQATDVAKKGKEGIGANKRTGVYTGGGAALGAIIGAIAGGGKGAAIGAGAGAGAGALTQILTRGKAIKVPVESVLTFNLDKELKVTAQ